MFPQLPFALSGPRIRLEPLSIEHAEGLWAAADDEVFAKLPYNRPLTVQAMSEWSCAALSREAVRLPFAVVVGREVAGTTSYWYPDEVRRQVEIGSTLPGRSWWESTRRPNGRPALPDSHRRHHRTPQHPGTHR
ncbi:GNAT family N-acetyltransferase [Streptomyces canus]|uniref:GNAT family N-acetyltransferase n=1 Tax=Streptomyces canus TaxID=58343 RepID=UPI0033A0864D